MIRNANASVVQPAFSDIGRECERSQGVDIALLTNNSDWGMPFGGLFDSDLNLDGWYAWNAMCHVDTTQGFEIMNRSRYFLVAQRERDSESSWSFGKYDLHIKTKHGACNPKWIRFHRNRITNSCSSSIISNLYNCTSWVWVERFRSIFEICSIS